MHRNRIIVSSLYRIFSTFRASFYVENFREYTATAHTHHTSPSPSTYACMSCELSVNLFALFLNILLIQFARANIQLIIILLYYQHFIALPLIDRLRRWRWRRRRRYLPWLAWSTSKLVTRRAATTTTLTLREFVSIACTYFHPFSRFSSEAQWWDIVNGSNEQTTISHMLSYDRVSSEPNWSIE